MAQSSQSPISLSICRIRKLVPNQGKPTSGGGCIVWLNLGGDASSPSRAPKSSPVLITTTQVISKNDLISPSSKIIVEFLEGRNLLRFNLDFKCASDLPDSIPGRVLGGTGDALKEVSFMVIPVEKFDNRHAIMKKVSSFLRLSTSFEKRSLTCNHESDDTLQSAISKRQVFCHVICDDRKSDAFNTELYCLEFGKDTSEFALTSPLDHDGLADLKQLKDFDKEEKPKGSPLLDADGKFVGMLGIAPSEERKLFPLFLPTQNKDNSAANNVGKDARNDTVKAIKETYIKGVRSCLEQKMTDEISCSQEERNPTATNNNQQSTQYQDENPGNCTTPEVIQGSGYPFANPLRSDNSSPLHDPDPAQADDEFLLAYFSPPPVTLTDDYFQLENDPPRPPADGSSLEEDNGNYAQNDTVKAIRETYFKGAGICLEQKMTDEISCSQEERNPTATNNNQQSTLYQGENPANCTTSEVIQGSGYPVANPLQSDNSSPLHDPDPAQADDEFLPAYFSPPSVASTDDYFQLENDPPRPPADGSSLEEDNGSLPELPETTLPKPTAEDVSSSQESEVELESSTEVERGFKHEEHILRSPSEPGASGHGAQGGFGQTTRQNTTPGDLDRVRPGSLPELPETTLPKPTAEDVSSLQESEVELESSTEVERGFKRDEHILRSPSEPGASGHGAQGGFGQTTRQNTTPGDLDCVRPDSPYELPGTSFLNSIAEGSPNVGSSQESEVDLESSTEDPTEVDRVFKRGKRIPRSLSEPSDSGHGAQGGFVQITRQNTTPGDRDRVRPGSLVKDKIVCRANIMDVLSLHLDRSDCPGTRALFVTQRWEQLADELEVPDDIKRQCENFGNGKLTPSESMFEYLSITNDSLTVGTLKTHLVGLRRQDVVDVLGNVSDKTTVTDLWEKHPETLCTVCLKLDDQRSLKNWMHLGSKLGISGGTLRKFKDPSAGCSPSEAILKKIKTLQPTLSITKIQAVLKELNLETIANKLDSIRDGNIQTLLGNLDVLENVTGMLDLQENSWRRFALKFHKFPNSFLDNLRPDPIPSPTKTVMNYIVQSNPNLSMRTFLLTLRKMERIDVIEELKEFFKPEDIEAILR